MHEYEFRLVVEEPTSFLPLLQSLGYPVRDQRIYYMKPHFRFRDGSFQTKRVKSTHAVYHDGLWFRWVHSVEKSYPKWSKSTCSTFVYTFGNYQQPLTPELRYTIAVDSRAQLYTFRTEHRTHRLIFEWEYGLFDQPPKTWPYEEILRSLSRYRSLYRLLEPYSPLPFKLNEQMTRRPVLAVADLPTQDCLYAHKLDGTFGIVLSYRDKIKEKWEGHECVVRRGVSLAGGGFVFAAERLAGGEVYLLDVYQVRGHPTAPWCRRQILTEFLRGLELPEGYFVQRYVRDPENLERSPAFQTDGWIAHNVKKDVIYKVKTHHSIDLVHNEGYFYLPDGRFRCAEKDLENGCVYEISIETGRVIRRRKDRFKGNTATQLESVLKNGWHGPPIEPLPAIVNRKKSKK